MLLTRIWLPAGLTATAMQYGPLRCGVPTLLAARGVDAAGDGASILAFEWPTEYAALPGEAPEQKLRNEHRQLERLRRDFRAGGRPDPFSATEQIRDDPPDFVCTQAGDGADIGVELTQLTVGERIAEQQLFERTKRQVLRRGRGQLGHLRDYAVVVTFYDETGAPARPPQSGLADRLLDALRQYEPPKRSSVHAIPEQVPPEMAPKQFDGIELHATLLAGGPGGMFHRLMRWELLLSSSEWISDSETWDEFVHVVAQKDKAVNDTLVLTCGGPTTPSNQARPADTLKARAVVRTALAQRVPATKNLSRVWVHSWPEASVHEMVPGAVGATRLCGDAFDEQPMHS
jgi:hypothetical protein